jgi:alcohol dehydrogenase class IV
LATLGLGADDVDRVAEEAAASPYANPRTADRDDVRAILGAALRGDQAQALQS